MRTPNSMCEICNKKAYRRPAQIKKQGHICCKECRSELYKRFPEIVKNLSKGHGWNKGMSKANGDKLSYGRPRSNETKNKISKSLEGRKFSKHQRESMSKARIKLFDKIGRIGKHDRGWEFARWKRAIYKRDNYLCQKCDSTDNLRAHHILSWKDYPALRFVLNNGITLCKKCHEGLHRNKTRNNPINEYLLRREPQTNRSVALYA